MRSESRSSTLGPWCPTGSSAKTPRSGCATTTTTTTITTTTTTTTTSPQPRLPRRGPWCGSWDRRSCLASTCTPGHPTQDVKTAKGANQKAPNVCHFHKRATSVPAEGPKQINKEGSSRRAGPTSGGTTTRRSSSSIRPA